MNIYRNDKLIKRNARIGQFSMLGGLAVLGGGMFISFRYPEQFSLSLGALVIGFLLSQIGIFFSNRWGRRPRPDELLDKALKGLDQKYALYHFLAPVNHLLVGPAGVWVLLPYHQRGTISYENGRFKQRGGSLYLKIFAQEGLGRPEMEATGELENLTRYLKKQFPEQEFPPVQAALVFTNPKTEINLAEDADPPARLVLIKDLKEMIRKTAKEKTLAAEKIKLIQDDLKVETSD